MNQSALSFISYLHFIFHHLDQSILKLMKQGITKMFQLTIIACAILLTYNCIYPHPALYEVGTSLFKSSLFFIVSFIIFGISFNQIKNDLKT